MDPAVSAWLSLENSDPNPHVDPAVVRSIMEGISRRPTARISQVFLYDDLGTKLYEEITRTPEYYLTAKEAELLDEHAADIATDPRNCEASEAAASEQPSHQVVIELGAGEGQKTMLLLRALTPLARRTVYAPIDVSSAALDSNAATAAPLQPQLETHPFLGRFEECVPHAAALGGRKLFLFMGSSLGNYSDDESTALLRLVALHMDAPAAGAAMTHGSTGAGSDAAASGDRFLIGVDLPHSERSAQLSAPLRLLLSPPLFSASLPLLLYSTSLPLTSLPPATIPYAQSPLPRFTPRTTIHEALPPPSQSTLSVT